MEENDGGLLKCSQCKGVFYYKHNLNRHVKRIHEKHIPRTTLPKTVMCKEDKCNRVFRTVVELSKHLEADHHLENFSSSENHTFNSKLEFQKWLSDEELASGSKYITKNSSIKRYKCSTTRLHCNRSGKYTPKGQQKQLKVQGTAKIGHHCTSRIVMKEYSSHIEATYFKKHYKHDTHELCHLPIPEKEKQVIADKLLQGISETRILQDIRKTLDPSAPKRIHLITKKDLNSIKKKYGITYGGGKKSATQSDEESVPTCLSRIHENIIKQHKGKLTKKSTLNFKRHKEAETLNVTLITISTDKWQISSSDIEETFTVKKNHICTSTCVVACRLCMVCSTAYQCSCRDYSIGKNICKHIHYIISQDNNEIYVGPLNTFSVSKTTSDNSFSKTTSDNSFSKTTSGNSERVIDQHEFNKQNFVFLSSQYSKISSMDKDISLQINTHLNAIKHLMTQNSLINQSKNKSDFIELKKQSVSKKQKLTKKLSNRREN